MMASLRKRNRSRRSFAVVALAFAFTALVAASSARARLGGGQSFSGGSHSSSSFSSHSSSSSSFHSSSSFSSHSSSSYSGSSGGGGGSDATGMVIFLIVLVGFVVLFMWLKSSAAVSYASTSTYVPEAPRAPRREPTARLVRTIDPTFSEIVFLEWATLFFMRWHKARGENDLASIAPFLAPDVLNASPRERDALKSVDGIVVGGAGITRVERGVDRLSIVVRFEATYTTTFASGESQAWWTHESWTFERALSAKSRLPDDVERLGCPSCGSALERTSLARCASCGNALTPGAHDWCVARIDVQEREKRGPLLTGNVAEAGTHLPTIYAPDLPAARQRITTWPQFEQRARFIFGELEQGWTAQKWERLRPWETEAVFQQHRFWLEEYQRQKLRNVLDRITLQRVDVCKVDDDPHYDVVTARMSASMIDCTVDQQGRVVAGDPRSPRAFTEYWTFVRRLDAKAPASTSTTQCPSCGAPLSISQAGVCDSCGSKVTTGKFDWVLSRIEQDEEYAG
jgi:predicted lipid-binding transport protein (Tim44 family)